MVATTLSLACNGGAPPSSAARLMIEKVLFIISGSWTFNHALRITHYVFKTCGPHEFRAGIQIAPKRNGRRRCHCDGRSCIADGSWRTRWDNKSGWAKRGNDLHGPGQVSRE